MRRKNLIDAALHAVLLLVLVFLVGLRLWTGHSRGFRVRIASDTCGGFPSCFDTLSVTGEGRLLFGGEAIGMDGLVSDLSHDQIYGDRSERVIYFTAADNVPFQKIAEVIDALQYAAPDHVPPLPEALRNSAADDLNIELRWVTAGAVNTPCHNHSYNWWKEGELCGK